MNQIKRLRNLLGYTQLRLAKALGVSRSTVAMWETTSQEPDFDTLEKLAQIFNVSPAFIVGLGCFKDWDRIIENYDAVCDELLRKIPRSLEMPSFSGDIYLVAWLDLHRYDKRNEIQLARWFDFSVKYVDIILDPQSQSVLRVSVQFTPEFNAVISSATKEKPATVSGDGQDPNTVRIAGRDGSLFSKRLTDEQLAALKSIIEQMPEADADYL